MLAAVSLMLIAVMVSGCGGSDSDAADSHHYRGLFHGLFSGA